MIGIEVTFLTGRYVAAAHNRRDGHEWPPHWARMFGALVAAWGEHDEDPADAALLQAMEGWGDPQIAASDASYRRASVHWVPVNDATVLGLALQQRRSVKLDAALQKVADVADGSPARRESAEKRVAAARDVAAQVARLGATPPQTALELLPEHRIRQERRFPSLSLDDPRVLFAWLQRTESPVDASRLDDLLARVTRLGHSSSMVTCRVVTELPPGGPELRFVPDAEHGDHVLRSVGAGQLDALVSAHRHHQGARPRSMPHRAARYRDRAVRPDTAPPPPRSSLSGTMIVFERTAGPKLPVVRAVDVARALRGTLMAHAADPIPEIISGHVPSSGHGTTTAPSQRPHLAYLPLAFVDHPHATGHLLGAALLLPAAASDEDRASVDAALLTARRAGQGGGDVPVRPDAPLRLRLGRAGVVELAPVLASHPLHGLVPETWSRSSRTWRTATPIALPRHPGRLPGARGPAARRGWDMATEQVVAACRHVGLPDPAAVHVQLAPVLTGSRHVRDFPRFVQGRGPRQQVRALVHAEVTFDDPVGGPIVLGAGRYQGLGLMRPAVSG